MAAKRRSAVAQGAGPPEHSRAELEQAIRDARLAKKWWARGWVATLWELQRFIRQESSGGECMEGIAFGALDLEYRGLRGRNPYALISGVWLPDQVELYRPRDGYERELVFRIPMIPGSEPVARALEYVEKYEAEMRDW